LIDYLIFSIGFVTPAPGALKALSTLWRIIMGLPRLFVVALVAVSSVSAPTAQSIPSKDPDQLVGAWRLIVAKSRYRPGPAPTNETRTYVRDGENLLGVIQRAFPDGRRERIEYTANYDREYPVTGTEDYDHVVLKRIDRYTSEAVLSHAGRVFGTARRVIAADGKSMTITFRRDSESGVSVLNFAYYEKLPEPSQPE
jgi:hypothetical protein